MSDQGYVGATGYAFAELLKLSDRLAHELMDRGPECQVPMIVATMSVEAFLNDVAHLAGRTGANEGAATLASLVDLINSERIISRLLLTHYLLAGERLRKDKNPYQDFAALVGLRNALIHRSPEEWAEHPTEGKRPHPDRTVPFFLQHLSNRKVAQGAVTVQDLLTPSVAKWAVRVAGDIVLLFLGVARKRHPNLAFVLAGLIQPHFGGDGQGKPKTDREV